jgi:hypothetical protein
MQVWCDVAMQALFGLPVGWGEAMSQETLLDWAASQTLARASDPETSVAAADRVVPKLYGLRAKFVEGVCACGGQATAKEAANAVSDNPEVVDSVRKRARECVERGFVRVVGQRACSISKQVASIYEVVE